MDSIMIKSTYKSHKFEKQFTCLGQNTEKYITLTVTIKITLQELIKME